MPLQRRLPKRGFKNRFRVAYAPVNVGSLSRVFESGDTVELDALKERGLVSRRAPRWKLLGSGEIDLSVSVKADACSPSARQKVEAAGGTVEVPQIGVRGRSGASRVGRRPATTTDTPEPAATTYTPEPEGE